MQRILARVFSTSLKQLSKPLQNVTRTERNYVTCCPMNTKILLPYSSQPLVKSSLLNNSEVIGISNNIITRSVTKFSLRKGKRKSVKTVIKRFYRLHWGGWIRTIAGRHKKLWKKSENNKRRLRQHVLCNATQSTLLDKMVGPYWHKRRFYVDDPYEPYHSREEFLFTSVKPKPYFPPDK